jgi:hypothetical protein
VLFDGREFSSKRRMAVGRSCPERPAIEPPLTLVEPGQEDWAVVKRPTPSSIRTESPEEKAGFECLLYAAIALPADAISSSLSS